MAQQQAAPAAVVQAPQQQFDPMTGKPLAPQAGASINSAEPTGGFGFKGARGSMSTMPSMRQVGRVSATCWPQPSAMCCERVRMGWRLPGWCHWQRGVCRV